MNCPKCQKENEANALYCNQCGTPIGKVKKSGIDYSAIMLFIFILIELFSSIFRLLITFIGDSLFDNPYTTTIIQMVIGILTSICYILIPLAIKNLTLKIICLIITVLLIIYWVSNSIMSIINICSFQSAY